VTLSRLRFFQTKNADLLALTFELKDAEIVELSAGRQHSHKVFRQDEGLI
jgi:hypothetical protein